MDCGGQGKWIQVRDAGGKAERVSVEVVRNGRVDVCKLEVGLGWFHRLGVEHRER